MDSLIGFGSLLLLFLALGALLGWISFFKYQKLNEQVRILQKTIDRMRIPSGMQETIKAEEIKTVRKVMRKGEKKTVVVPPSVPPRPKTEPNVAPLNQPQKLPTKNFLDKISENWMVWLGGICVGLAGIFLVKHSIDAGLLGPTQRVISGYCAGFGLHALAEWLRRKTGESHPSFAALAGGASITLYAATLAALHLYQMLSPGIAFTILAIISMLTMLLALRDGPVLAIIGILGAYVVPILVSDNSGNILGAMIYALIISAAALFLIRYVYRPWLWYGVLSGGIGWWLISLTSFYADGYRGFYLAAFAYCLLAIPSFDWVLNKAEDDCEPIFNPKSKRLFFLHPINIGMGFILLAQSFSIVVDGFSNHAFFLWAPLYLVILLIGVNRESARYLPWLSLVAGWFSWLFCGVEFINDNVQLRGLGVETQQYFLLFSLGMILLYSGATWIISRGKQYSHLNYSLITLAPVVWFALTYLLVSDLSVSWEWSLAGAILAIFYIALANYKERNESGCPEGMWLILAGHFSFSLAAAMFIREASLTLVLAIQVLSLVYLMNMYRMDALKWLVKGVLALIIIRLTLNPWLLHYPLETHWSLWTYGGTTLCCFVASLLLSQEKPLKKWLEAASLHLFVLFLASETRYWLYDGNIFMKDYTLIEASINSMLWAGLGLVYYYRSIISDHLKGYYSFCSKLLIVLALSSYLLVLTFLSPLFNWGTIGHTPIWNLLLLSHGVPALMGILCLFFYNKNYRRYSALFSGLSLFVFVNMEIRHLWQRGMNLDLPVSDGELYTYSIVWLVMAIPTILVAANANLQKLNKAGMILLLLVIAKIFLIDMADLEGLLRVTSFMGLGLSLLGLAFLYQRITRDKNNC